MTTLDQRLHVFALCAQIAEEKDSSRFLLLVHELSDLLEESERETHAAPLAPALPGAKVRIISPGA
jgi:hypothetical protein